MHINSKDKFMVQIDKFFKKNGEASQAIAKNIDLSCDSLSLNKWGIIEQVRLNIAEIRKNSERSEDIFTVLDSLSFQTHVLTLNTSVEASIAGEDGQSLSVLAREARMLANQSAESVKEVKIIISENLMKIRECSRQVDRTVMAIHDVLDMVRNMASLAAEIGASTAEQGLTQRMSALDEDIAGLAEFHIRVRKAAFLGKPNHYVRRVFAGFRGGEISNDQREYLSQYFCLYQSHTQGSTVIESRQEDVQPAHLKWQRRNRYMLLFSFFGFVWLGWKIFLEEPKKPAPKMQPIALSGVASKPVEISPAAPAKVSQSSPVAPASVQHAVYVPPTDTGPEPFETRGVHLTGCMERLSTHETLCTFVVSQNGMPLFQITDSELKEYGYSFKLLWHCAGHIAWGGKVRAVVCDVPQVGMQVAGVGRQ